MGLVKAAIGERLSEVETPPKAAAEDLPKRLHFYCHIDIDSYL
jgi:hypothetical protein